ncbi:MAG: hypothetical protein K2Y32_06865 [Candidatus Obscuribacterales bacterium]|nr:hypothetical protein [Candidatus Obscuribacterales bacterium]
MGEYDSMRGSQYANRNAYALGEMQRESAGAFSGDRSGGFMASSRMLSDAQSRDSLRSRQGCDFQKDMNGKSMGEQLDILRQYQKESKSDSQHLPKIDLKMDKDGRGYEVQAKPNPEENSNKGNRSETIMKHREHEDGSTAEQSCKNMPLQERPMMATHSPLSSSGDSGAALPMESMEPKGAAGTSDSTISGGSSYNNDNVVAPPLAGDASGNAWDSSGKGGAGANSAPPHSNPQ